MKNGTRMKDAKKSKEISGLRGKTHESVDKIIDKAESIRDQGKEKMTQIKDKVKVLRENVDDFIETNPEKSVLIAAGVGAVAGAALAAALLRKKTADADTTVDTVDAV